MTHHISCIAKCGQLQCYLERKDAIKQRGNFGICQEIAVNKRLQLTGWKWKDMEVALHKWLETWVIIGGCTFVCFILKGVWITILIWHVQGVSSARWHGLGLLKCYAVCPSLPDSTRQKQLGSGRTFKSKSTRLSWMTRLDTLCIVKCGQCRFLWNTIFQVLGQTYCRTL